MTDMARPRPPYLLREQTRHGVFVWYVRKGRGPRTRIKAEYGTPAFVEEYKAALAGEVQSPKPIKPVAGSLRWLIDRYRETQAWFRLSPATRKQREAIFRQMIDGGGTEPHKDITRKTVQAGLDRRSATPFQAKHFLYATRGLFQWAVAAELASVDPTEGIKAEVPHTDGFRVWTEEDVAQFQKRWPLGTREHLALDLALYTGLRKGDLAILGRQHVKAGIITIMTKKTRQEVTLPILPILARTIAATPSGTLSYIVGKNGQPLTKESFGNWFGEACRAAGVAGSAHGLRKLGATRAADNGATEAQLEALFGWRGGRMASLYTRASNRRRLAIEAMSKMAAPEQSDDVYPRTINYDAPHLPKK